MSLSKSSWVGYIHPCSSRNGGPTSPKLMVASQAQVARISETRDDGEIDQATIGVEH